MGYRDYSTAKGLIVDATGHGDFTTITAASAAASSGQTVFIRSGTYTENPPLTAGVTYSGFNADGYNPTVVINGKCTFSSAGSVSMGGLCLQTNGDYALAITGSAASIINLKDCFIKCVNHTGLNHASSSSSAQLNLYECKGDTSTTGIAYFNHSSAGDMTIQECRFLNNGLSTTNNTCSAGSIEIHLSFMEIGLDYSSSGESSIFATDIDFATLGLNHTVLNATGTSIVVYGSYLASGSASAITVGGGAFVGIANSTVFSSNTNAIAGTGSLTGAIIVFNGPSSTIQGTLTVAKYTVFGGTIV